MQCYMNYAVHMNYDCIGKGTIICRTNGAGVGSCVGKGQCMWQRLAERKEDFLTKAVELCHGEPDSIPACAIDFIHNISCLT